MNVITWCGDDVVCEECGHGERVPVDFEGRLVGLLNVVKRHRFCGGSKSWRLFVDLTGMDRDERVRVVNRLFGLDLDEVLDRRSRFLVADVKRG